MANEKKPLRRQLALVVASSLCATAALPALGGEAAGAGGALDAQTAANALPAASSAPGGQASLFDQPLFAAATGSVAESNSSAQPVPVEPGSAVKPDASASPDSSASAAKKPAPESSDAGVDPATKKVLATPSQNVTINLIRRLVQRGVLSEQDASDLIKQAQADAEVAKAQSAAAQAAADAGLAAQAEASKAAAAAQAALAQAAPVTPSADDVSVTYIPETVKAQMREQIKDEVMAEAEQENWAVPHGLPDWVSRFRLIGDVRVRYEGDWFPAGNAIGSGSPFWNYNAINTVAPYDYTGVDNPPIYDANQDRNRFRLRARFGAEMDLGEGFTAGFRLGTGETDSPVTESQTFGLSNQGQGGNFSRYAIWLDRAFLEYEVGQTPDKDLTFTIGRFNNPFFATTMVWADDLGFDGGVVQGHYEVHDGVKPFLTLGAFPVFNTDLNFSSIQESKYKSEDKWLFGGQLGTDWKINKDFEAKLAAAMYYFENIEGKISSPFTPLTAQDQGNTDDSRPGYAQRGNTYVAIRNIVPDVTNNFGATNQWQYFGLATPFHELSLTGRLDYNHFEPFQVSLTGEFVKNIAFDRNAIEQNGPPQLLGPVNNNNPNGGGFGGGDTAWIVNLKAGSAALEKRWDWQAGINYRYVESDSVVDGFCDADFGLGGTNLKGYTIYGNLALSSRVWMGIRWMSSNSIAGPPFKIDILQVDLNATF